MILVRTLLLSTAVLALLPSTGNAQPLRSTGVDVTAGRDNRWSVSNDGGATFAAAFVVTNPPGAWTPNTGAYSWIGVSASGTGGSGSYRARTQFSVSAGDALSVTLRCTADNSPLGIFINGALAGGSGGCGGGNSFRLAPAMTFTDWIMGLNTLEIRWTGDGTTDGALVSIDNVTLSPGVPGVVPEPSTYALLASGLGILALTARRRQRTI